MTANAPELLQRIKEEHQALAILQLLASDVACGQLNDRVLGECLREAGLTIGRDQLRQLLDRMERDGLVETRTADTYLVATLTGSGEEVAVGRKCVAGVARPARP